MVTNAVKKTKPSGRTCDGSKACERGGQGRPL